MSITYWKGGKEVFPPIQKVKKSPVIPTGCSTERKPRWNLLNNSIFAKEENEIYHHINNRLKIPIPKDIHQKFSGYSRTKHRKMIEQWAKMNSPLYYWMIIETRKLTYSKEVKVKYRENKRENEWKIRSWDKRSKKVNKKIIREWILHYYI